MEPGASHPLPCSPPYLSGLPAAHTFRSAGPRRPPDSYTRLASCLRGLPLPCWVSSSRSSCLLWNVLSPRGFCGQLWLAGQLWQNFYRATYFLHGPYLNWNDTFKTLRPYVFLFPWPYFKKKCLCASGSSRDLWCLCLLMHSSMGVLQTTTYMEYVSMKTAPFKITLIFYFIISKEAF